MVEFGNGFFEQFEGLAQVAALFVEVLVFGDGAVVVGNGSEVYRAQRFHALFVCADVGGKRRFVRRVVVVNGKRFAPFAEEFGGDALQLLLDLREVFLVVVKARFGKGALVLAFAQRFLFTVQVVRLFFNRTRRLRPPLFVLLVFFFARFVA